ncbi:MAG: adenylate/guanylate cyclase domain-containing protein [Cyclobacteriaceae bacterium]
MKIYEDYLTGIRNAISSQHISEAVNFSAGIEKSLQNKYELPSSMQGLSDLLQRKSLKTDQKLGAHPDFNHLDNFETENHYIVSVFIDIKNSTGLFRKLSPEKIFVITRFIQLAGIHTCQMFNGYVHRLQGDGLFLYFGNRQDDARMAVTNALQAVSLYTYFIKEDLPKVLDELNLDQKIFVRTGIDLGEAKDVVWGKAGIGEVSEITTTSLHTSLASKMQGHAQSNGVVVGNNVIKKLPSSSEYFAPVVHRTKTLVTDISSRILTRAFTMRNMTLTG